MKIGNKIFLTAVTCVSLFFGSCETTDLDQLEDPSGVPASLLDPNFAFNYVQLQLPNFVHTANNFTQRVTRQMAMTGGNTYENAFEPVNFDNNWGTAYNILQTVKIMEPKATQNRQFYALGAAKVIRCYVLASMVDMYGNIPYSEALLGNENLNPRFDNSADVYKGVLTELDAAIAMLSETSINSTDIQDLYYGGTGNWITLAKTIKLKMYCTARLAGADLGVDIPTAISGIISGGDYIDTKDEDFAFQYGNNRNNPNSRHPVYNDQYELGGGAYIGNYMAWAMTTEKVSLNANFNVLSGPRTMSDPRVSMYFFKQDADPQNEDAFTLPNRTRPDHYNNTQYNSFYDGTTRTPFKVSNWTSGALPQYGFWGRDHGDNSGIPPDNDKRSVVGVYPAGGAYGNASSVQTSGRAGALGAGIMPIIMSSYVHFLKAEAILTLGISGDARTEFETGIRQSMDKAINLVPDYPVAAEKALLTAKIDPYVTIMLAQYDSFDNTKKLELIMKEYYIAAWGNGLEPYNNYRRTGYPSNFQPTLEPTSGVFFSTALYPSSSVVNNTNAPANLRTKKVFWDKANLTLN